MAGTKRKGGNDTYTDNLARLRRGESKHGGALTNDEEQKRRDLLERNRLAAQRCRKRKKSAQVTLEEEGNRLTSANEKLQTLVEELRQEVGVLRAAITGHQQASKGCHSGGLSADTVERVHRPLPEMKRPLMPHYSTSDMISIADSPSTESSMSRTSSHRLSGEAEDVYSPLPTQAALPPRHSTIQMPAMTIAGMDKAVKAVQTPAIDPDLITGQNSHHSGATSFPFYDYTGASSTTPGGNNVDLSAFFA